MLACGRSWRLRFRILCCRGRSPGAGRLVTRSFSPDDGHHLGIVGPICSRPPTDLAIVVKPGILVEITAQTASSRGTLAFLVDRVCPDTLVSCAYPFV